MDNLINFPAKAVREKNSFDKAVRTLLTQSDINSEAIDSLMAKLHPLWDQYQHQFNISFSLPSTLNKSDAEKINTSFRDALERFQRDLYNFNSTLLLDRVKAEIKIYRLEHDL